MRVGNNSGERLATMTEQRGENNLLKSQLPASLGFNGWGLPKPGLVNLWEREESKERSGK